MWNRLFEGKGIPISNRGLEIPAHVNPNVAATFYTDGGVLPAGGAQEITRSSVGFVSFALALQFTGAALDAAGKDELTYATALTFNVRNAAIDAIKLLNIFAFGDSTGTLSLAAGGDVLSTTANTVLNLQLSDGNRNLRKNMTVDIVSGGLVKTTGSIVSIPLGAGQGGTGTTASTQVTLGPVTAAYTTVAGDTVVLSGSFNTAIQGLKSIIDDGTLLGTFQSVNRTNVPQFKGNVIALVGSPAMARDHLRRSIALIQIARGEVDLSGLELWSHPSQLHAYADMGWQLKRFNDAGSKLLDLGFTAYEFEGIPWVVETDAPKDHLFFIQREALLKVTARELSFDDRTGAILRQVPATTAGQYTDQFVAFLLFRGNLGAYAPNMNTKVSGEGIPVGY